MQETGCREQYPLTTVLVSNLLSVLLYGTGISILFQAGLLFVIGYVAFILILETRLIGWHCVDCYYYGKTCAFGKGRLSSLFFRKGSPEKFPMMTLTWKDMVPDFLVFIIPVLAGILLLVREFSWTILVLIIALFLLGFMGNAFVRTQLACRYCRQKEIGCPAAELFNQPGKP
ncbi:MAG: hypothetical protein LUQ35_04680 [Methanoregula sp.]|jgi:hypothetical protein|nr:hypothetical protein [Methanoregula sp.]